MRVKCGSAGLPGLVQATKSSANPDPPNFTSFAAVDHESSNHKGPRIGLLLPTRLGTGRSHGHTTTKSRRTGRRGV